MKLFGKCNGKDVYLYTLSNENLEVTIMNYGATIQSLKVKTAEGFREITLGYDKFADYLEKPNYFGATIGRVANRISGGAFTLHGKEYRLDRNDGDNCLHGGFVGYDKKVFDGEEKPNELIFTLNSRDGDQGFPANLKLKVSYKLEASALIVTYTAESDGDTFWNPTNHTFFNLGGRAEPVYKTELKINADRYTLIDKKLIPTGELKSVKGTPFDFTDYKKIGKEINADDGQLRLVSGGYDHNFVLNSELAASAKYDGVQMDVSTDMPGIQLYTGNFLGGVECRNGVFNKHFAFCLEPQYFPNAINTEGFEKPIIKQGEMKTHYIKYSFKL